MHVLTKVNSVGKFDDNLKVCIKLKLTKLKTQIKRLTFVYEYYHIVFRKVKNVSTSLGNRKRI